MFSFVITGNYSISADNKVELMMAMLPVNPEDKLHREEIKEKM